MLSRAISCEGAENDASGLAYFYHRVFPAKAIKVTLGDPQSFRRSFTSQQRLSVRGGGGHAASSMKAKLR
jgi:hypothetical protein